MSSALLSLVCGTNLTEATGAEVGSLFENDSTIDVQILNSTKLVWSTPEKRSERLQQLQALNAAVARTSINRRLDTDAPFVALWTPLTISGRPSSICRSSRTLSACGSVDFSGRPARRLAVEKSLCSPRQAR